MNLDNPAVPVFVLNILIVLIIAGIVLYLKEPLGILALFLLSPIPQSEYYAEDDGETSDVIGEELSGEYDGQGMGFTGKNTK